MNFQKYNIFFSNPEIKGIPMVLFLLQVHPDMVLGEHGKTERKVGNFSPISKMT